MTFTKVFTSERGFIELRSALVLVFSVFCLVMASALQAKPVKPVQTKKSPFIEAVMIMYGGEPEECFGALDTLTIIGANLVPADASGTTVTLATYEPLTICTTPTMEQLIVALPPNSEPGDYLLSVATADGVATYDLTVGALGPQGPRGPAGADGKDGADGLPGADGKDGLPGADGKDGLPGADGKDGLPGVSVGGWSFGYTMPNGNGFETSTNLWLRVGTFVYRGTNIDPTPTLALATLYTTNTNTWYRLRLRDITSNLVIAASAPNNTGTHGAEAVVSLGVLSNLPPNTAQFSIELLATDATGFTSVAGRQNVGIQSFQMW